MQGNDNGIGSPGATTRPTPQQWLSRLPNLKRVGNQLQGSCPQCGGTDRFHVNLAPPHLYGCRKCNTGGAIHRLVLGNGHTPAPMKVPKLTHGPRRATGSWTHENVHGQTITLTRFEGGGHPKSFMSEPQHVRGPWHVYLAYAPDDPDPAGPLVLCEGETKADAIAEIGLTGASWRGGAEQAGNAIYERLQGRDVVLWPDSDAPGRKAGQAAAAALDGIAASIRIVDAPAVEGKNDAADYSPDERRALVDAAVPWEPTAESDNGPPPDCPRAVDAQWLIDNANDSLAALGSGFLVLGPAGLWTQYSDHAPGKQAPLGSLARRKALSAGLQPPTVSPRWYSTIRDGLHVGIVDKQIQRFQAAHMMKEPIIPFETGAHLHLSAHDLDICHCDIGPTKTLDLGWSIPEPDFALCDRLPAVCDQFGVRLLQALSRYLLGPMKALDMLRADKSDSGKSTLAAALAAALPGAIQVVNALEVLDQRRTRFCPHKRPLAESRLVIFDEGGRLTEDITNELFGVTGDTLLLEGKGQDTVIVPRVGSPCFFGHKFPPVDVNAQGVKERIGQPWSFEDLKPIDGATRDRWLSPEEIARLRACMLRWAQATFETRTTKTWYGPERDELIREMDPPIIRFLRERFMVAPDGFVNNADIKAALAEGGHPEPANKTWGAMIRRAFQGAEDRHHLGQRGWAGVSPRP